MICCEVGIFRKTFHATWTFFFFFNIVKVFIGSFISRVHFWRLTKFSAHNQKMLWTLWYIYKTVNSAFFTSFPYLSFPSFLSPSLSLSLSPPPTLGCHSPGRGWGVAGGTWLRWWAPARSRPGGQGGPPGGRSRGRWRRSRGQRLWPSAPAWRGCGQWPGSARIATCTEQVSNGVGEPPTCFFHKLYITFRKRINLRRKHGKSECLLYKLWQLKEEVKVGHEI